MNEAAGIDRRSFLKRFAVGTAVLAPVVVSSGCFFCLPGGGGPTGPTGL